MPDFLCSAVFEVGYYIILLYIYYIAQFVLLGEMESVTVHKWIKVWLWICIGQYLVWRRFHEAFSGTEMSCWDECRTEHTAQRRWHWWPILCAIASVQCVQEADKRKQEACRVVSWSWALASSSRVTDALLIYLVDIVIWRSTFWCWYLVAPCISWAEFQLPSN